MELGVRQGADRFVPSGAYRALEERLRTHAVEDIPAVVLACFDRRTRLQPFLFYDSHIFPAGAALIAGALNQAGFRRTRAVFEQWNPRFRPDRARLDGQPLQMLLVSAMHLHAARADAAIRAVCAGGEDRPLIIAGGPRAVLAPYDYWSGAANGCRAAPDVAVTGEAYVLLELLDVILAHRGRGESMRSAFERARQDGALEAVPGLVYRAPGSTPDEPVLVDTGLQRLVQDLDELPPEFAGLSVIEPPHRREELSAVPIGAGGLGRHQLIVSLLMTQGCRFTCPYCPIPAMHQRSWRYRSPEAIAHVMRTIFERTGIKHFLAVDDNFFNRRDTAEAILGTLARSTVLGRPFGEKLRFVTEATEIDTWKNRDLLPLARAAGMHSIWFGIEDLTAALVKKGQKPERTIELFRLMHEQKICPMAMLMYHEGQPFYSRGSLYGLSNQIAFLRQAGAITVQCTVHIPALGTREYEPTHETGRVIARVGLQAVPDCHLDGNHVLTRGSAPPWKRQLLLWAAYASFYNPFNLARAFTRDGSRLRRRRIGFQLFGIVTTMITGWRILPYVFRLMRGPITCRTAAPPIATLPMHNPATAFPRYPAAVVQAEVSAPRVSVVSP